MKIYTKTGDEGKTSLFGGTRVSKANHRIETYGTVDELNSHLGMLRDQEVNKGRQEILKNIQQNLFVIGSQLATEKKDPKYNLPELPDDAPGYLEREMDQMNETIPPMKNFILPGGHPSVSQCHITRCVCRRAERLTVLLAEHEEIDKNILIYLNRLSDYLFVLARKIAHELGVEETPWKPQP